MLFQSIFLIKLYSVDGIKSITPDEIKALTLIKNDTTYIIHFWATWCAPCVKEIPEIQKLNTELKSKKFKLILISLDFENQVETKLIPFLKKNNIQSKCYLLKQERGYEWIDRIDNRWSGSLPASIIFNKDQYNFFEKSFSFNELNQLIIKYLIP